jgi:hypothetical protein
MKFSELIEHAVECIKTFNPVIKTIDSHADSFLEKVSCKPRLHCWSMPAVIQGTGTASNHSYLFAVSVETKIYFANAFLLQLSSKTHTNEYSSNRSSTGACAMKTSSR